MTESPLQPALDALEGLGLRYAVAYSSWMAGDDQGVLREDGRHDQIMQRQEAFWNAVASQLGRPELAPRRSSHQRLGYRQAVTLPGLAQPIQVLSSISRGSTTCAIPMNAIAMAMVTRAAGA